MDIMERSLQKHEEWHGKIEIISRAPIRNKEDLSLAYTPGVARPCLEIQKDEEKSFELTRRANIVAVVTDGTAVWGWEISDRLRPCPLWKENVPCLKSLAG